MKDQNVWNVLEYDTNKLICTTWNTAHMYFIDRNDAKTMRKPFVLEEKIS